MERYYEEDFYRSSEIKFHSGDLPDPYTPDSLNKAEIEHAMVRMLKEYGIGLQPMNVGKMIDLAKYLKF
jgi:hypothetical protein